MTCTECNTPIKAGTLCNDCFNKAMANFKEDEGGRCTGCYWATPVPCQAPGGRFPCKDD